MKKTRFTEAQIVGILKELDGGTPVTELARKHGIHANTIRPWRISTPGCKPAISCTLLKECISKHAQQRPRFGWRRLLILARREIPGTGEFRFRRLHKA